MHKSFLRQERDEMFKELTKQYKHEGYSLKEAKYYAKKDTEDVMSDKKTFIDNYIKDVWGEEDAT